MPAVSVIVPARDAAATLGRTLAALAEQSVDHEVIVVDDGSRDETAELARSLGATVITGAGRGPSSARNLGVAASSGDWLAFTDADCYPRPGWLEAGLAAGGDVVQGPVLPERDPGPFERTVSLGSPSPLFETANLLVRREWFDRVGGFEAWLLPAGSKELGEDVWLGWRLRRAGAQLAWAPAAIVEHAVFERRAAAFVAERMRLRFFPELVRRVPELRDELCFHRWFLTRRGAAFDLAAAGIAGAVLARRPGLALAALPYARIATAGRPRPRVAAARVAADAVGAVALLAGSTRARTPLL